MRSLLEKCRQFIRSEDAPTATEYAVMLALIIVVAIAAITLLGEGVRDTMQNTAETLNPA